MHGELPEYFNVAAHFLEAPAASHPERPAIVGEPHEISYGELTALANRTGNALRAQGVSQGDRVLMVLPDSVEFVAAFFGAAKIGAVAVPVNPFAQSSDYVHYLENSEPRAAIVHSNALAEFLPASGARPRIPIVVVGEEKTDLHGGACEKWSAYTALASDQLAAANTSPHDPAFMLYTSGSGGTPKAAVHRHADMLVTSRNYAQTILGLRADDVTFSVSKLFFAYGLGNGMYFPLSAGARTVLNPERINVAHVIEMVARHRPTVFFAVPTFFAAVLREAERPGHRVNFASVRQCVSAGETLPAEIFNSWKRQFGIDILDGIGSTEMLHI
ncbi:MAG: benzoate-CoA ligase family protein, partial [Acidobacteria bacterium]